VPTRSSPGSSVRPSSSSVPLGSSRSSDPGRPSLRTPVSDTARGPLRDEVAPATVVDREVAFEGLIWDVVRDSFDLGAAGRLRREYVAHTGSVAVLVLDEQDRVCVVRQYRHPLGAYLWELPAGLLDVEGEDPAEAAARELREEADLEAARWDVLVDYHATPGGSNEGLRVYLAREVTEVPEDERHARTGEELGMDRAWVPLDELVDGVLAGRLGNPSLVIGVLSAAALRSRGWSGLRPVGSAWPRRGPGRAVRP
jgi:8-oxo-dGTP pyrophosphatase MutT (NUDIX family)